MKLRSGPVRPARRTRPARAPGIAETLRHRLMTMLIVPLLVLAVINAWQDYRAAGNAAEKQDARLAALLPLLADSILGEGEKPGDAVRTLLAPTIAEFARSESAAIAVCDQDGGTLLGPPFLCALPPAGQEAELRTESTGGRSWRIARQRHFSVVGPVVVAVADSSDPRQQWAWSVFMKVLLPNLAMLIAAAVALRFAVSLALRPLVELRDAVEIRSPRDLSPLDVQASPSEVRPLVLSLNRLFGMVNAQVESQRRFVADAAHQLRTPLAGLQSQVEAWAQVADRTPAEPTMALPREQVMRLRDATRRTSQLASQLLALSRADASNTQSEPMRLVDLKALCEDALQQHFEAAEARRIDLGLDVAPAQTHGQEWLLREFVANLVDNAIKYTPAGGSVTLRCHPTEGGALLEVEDDGPGIPADERPRVVQRFYRLKGAHAEAAHADGNGLGLAIASEIARVHNAFLQLEAGRAGRGLRVSIELPLNPKPPAR